LFAKKAEDVVKLVLVLRDDGSSFLVVGGLMLWDRGSLFLIKRVLFENLSVFFGRHNLRSVSVSELSKCEEVIRKESQFNAELFWSV
jgi:hypothetical protein